MRTNEPRLFYFGFREIYMTAGSLCELLGPQRPLALGILLLVVESKSWLLSLVGSLVVVALFTPYKRGTAFDVPHFLAGAMAAVVSTMYVGSLGHPLPLVCAMAAWILIALWWFLLPVWWVQTIAMSLGACAVVLSLASKRGWPILN